MMDAIRETIAKIVCCPGGCILASCGDDACVALNPEHTMLPTADAILAALTAQPQYLANCLQAGACHGQCNSEPCTNFGKVIIVRRCVEPKQDGIVYPRMET